MNTTVSLYQKHSNATITCVKTVDVLVKTKTPPATKKPDFRRLSMAARWNYRIPTKYMVLFANRWRRVYGHSESTAMFIGTISGKNGLTLRVKEIYNEKF